MLSSVAVAQYSPPTSGLVGWWRGNGDANDSSGNGHDGTLVSGVGFTNGLFGQAFSFAGNPNRVVVPDSVDFALTNSISIGAWVYQAANSWAVLERGGNQAGSAAFTFGSNDAGQFTFEINSFSASDALFAPITYNQWTQITGTLDGNTGDMRLYVNGILVARKFTTVRPGGIINPALSPALGIGNEPDIGGFPFIGLVEEVVLYSRALTTNEVVLLTTNQSLPSITSEPQDKKAYVGSSITFNVTATGTPPLNYLWYKDGLPLTWATNSTLLLTNLATSDAGNYAVVVSNPFGLTTSTNAALTVGVATEQMDLFPGITISGLIGTSFNIQYTTNVSANSTWTTLTNLTLLQPKELWVDISTDVSSGLTPRRYYRAVFVPQ